MTTSPNAKVGSYAQPRLRYPRHSWSVAVRAGVRPRSSEAWPNSWWEGPQPAAHRLLRTCFECSASKGASDAWQCDLWTRGKASAGVEAARPRQQQLGDDEFTGVTKTNDRGIPEVPTSRGGSRRRRFAQFRHTLSRRLRASTKRAHHGELSSRTEAPKTKMRALGCPRSRGFLTQPKDLGRPPERSSNPGGMVGLPMCGSCSRVHLQPSGWRYRWATLTNSTCVVTESVPLPRGAVTTSATKPVSGESAQQKSTLYTYIWRLHAKRHRSFFMETVSPSNIKSYRILHIHSTLISNPKNNREPEWEGGRESASSPKPQNAPPTVLLPAPSLCVVECSSTFLLRGLRSTRAQEVGRRRACLSSFPRRSRNAREEVRAFWRQQLQQGSVTGARALRIRSLAPRSTRRRRASQRRRRDG